MGSQIHNPLFRRVAENQNNPKKILLGFAWWQLTYSPVLLPCQAAEDFHREPAQLSAEMSAQAQAEHPHAPQIVVTAKLRTESYNPLPPKGQGSSPSGPGWTTALTLSLSSPFLFMLCDTARTACPPPGPLLTLEKVPLSPQGSRKDWEGSGPKFAGNQRVALIQPEPCLGLLKIFPTKEGGPALSPGSALHSYSTALSRDPASSQNALQHCEPRDGEARRH